MKKIDDPCIQKDGLKKKVSVCMWFYCWMNEWRKINSLIVTYWVESHWLQLFDISLLTPKCTKIVKNKLMWLGGGVGGGGELQQVEREIATFNDVKELKTSI